MDFGINFFPAVGPEEMSGEQFFTEALDLSVLADELGYSHIRCVEHYFTAYGGYSPNPLVFLSAAAALTKRIKIITGAMLPVFNHPLKMAGEIAMVDAISRGRLQVGFARAFLPIEFNHFGRSMDESRARYNEGFEQVLLLLEQENVSHAGKFHSFKNVTSLPRPTQKPRPPFWVAASMSAETFKYAGEQGHYIMAIPVVAGQMAEMIGIYRDAWKGAGHKGESRVMLSFSMCCMPTTEEADRVFRGPVEGFKEKLLIGLKEWINGASSKDYPNYGPILAQMKDENYDDQKRKGILWSGSPEELRQMISDYRQKAPFDEAALNVKLHAMPNEICAQSMHLFSKEVAPHFKSN